MSFHFLRLLSHYFNNLFHGLGDAVKIAKLSETEKVLNQSMLCRI